MVMMVAQCARISYPTLRMHRFISPNFPFSSNKRGPANGNRSQIISPPRSIPIETTQALYDLADLDAATAGLASTVLRPVLSISSLLMIIRIVLTWYPEIDGTKLPWSIAYTPTGT